MVSDTEKLRNITKIPGMKELVGSLGVEVIEDMAERVENLQAKIDLALLELAQIEGEKTPTETRVEKALKGE